MKISTLVALDLASSRQESLTIRLDGVNYTFKTDQDNDAEYVANDRGLSFEQAKVGVNACLSLLC